MAKQRRQRSTPQLPGGYDPGQAADTRQLLAGNAMAESLQRQADQWANLSRRQKDAAADAVLYNRAQQAIKDSADRLAASTRTVTIAYGLASAGLLSWVRAGMSGTTVGEQLSFQQQQLSQQIASIFLPVIQRYVDALTRLVQWFRSLSGEQQEQIRRWALFTVGLLGSVTIVPRLTAAFGTLGATLKGLALANPFAALAAAVIGLMAQTEEGRDSLAKMGKALSDAFEAVAGFLAGPLADALAGLAQFVSSAPGQWLAWGTIAVSVLYRIAAAGQGAATAFLGWSTAIGSALLLLGGIVTMLSKSNDAALKTVEGIAAGVRAGQTSLEQARRQIQELALMEGFQAELKERRKIKTSGGIPEEWEDFVAEVGRKRQREIEEAGEAFLKRAGKGRQDLVKAGGGTEDPRATIRRLEAASLRAGGDPAQKTAENTTAISQMMREVIETIRRAAGKDGREKPPKAD